jgi:hypothetical protein
LKKGHKTNFSQQWICFFKDLKFFVKIVFFQNALANNYTSSDSSLFVCKSTDDHLVPNSITQDTIYSICKRFDCTVSFLIDTIETIAKILFNFLMFRNHNVTFLHGFPSDNPVDGLHEITPLRLVNYLKNLSNWDLIGGRREHLHTLDFWKILEFEIEVISLESAHVFII